MPTKTKTKTKTKRPANLDSRVQVGYDKQVNTPYRPKYNPYEANYPLVRYVVITAKHILVYIDPMESFDRIHHLKNQYWCEVAEIFLSQNPTKQSAKRLCSGFNTSFLSANYRNVDSAITVANELITLPKSYFKANHEENPGRIGDDLLMEQFHYLIKKYQIRY